VKLRTGFSLMEPSSNEAAFGSGTIMRLVCALGFKTASIA
jgi:hypothetical protein